MQSKLYLSLTILAAATLTSCSKMGALSSDNFSVNPSPLESVGGQVPATINGRFPEKYMKKKAVVTVTPVMPVAKPLVTQLLSKAKKWKPTTRPSLIA